MYDSAYLTVLCFFTLSLSSSVWISGSKNGFLSFCLYFNVRCCWKNWNDIPRPYYWLVIFHSHILLLLVFRLLFRFRVFFPCTIHFCFLVFFIHSPFFIVITGSKSLMFFFLMARSLLHCVFCIDSLVLLIEIATTHVEKWFSYAIERRWKISLFSCN